jgi:hypothetical protein
MNKKNVNKKLILGLFIAIAVIAFLVSLMIFIFTIQSYVKRKNEEKKIKNIEKNQLERKQKIESALKEKDKLFKERNNKEKNQRIDNLVIKIQNNNIFNLVNEDLNINFVNNVNYDNFDINNMDFQNRVKSFFTRNEEFSDDIMLDRNQKYNESKEIVSNLEKKTNKTLKEDERLEWAKTFIKFHEENLKRMNFEVQKEDFFKKLEINLEDVNNGNISKELYDKKIFLINLLLYRGSIIYDYFIKYTLNKVSENSEFYKESFKKESLYIIQNLYKDFVIRIIGVNDFNEVLNKDLRVFDGLFFKEIYELFQSRLKIIEDDLNESAEYNRTINVEKTNDEIIKEDLERRYFNNINDLEEDIYIKQNKFASNDDYFRVIPNPYLLNSEFNRSGNYENDLRYNHDMNLQQKIIHRDQNVKKLKTNYVKRYNELINQNKEQKNKMIEEKIINPRLSQRFIIGFSGEGENDLNELIKNQKKRLEDEKIELEKIKNIGEIDRVKRIKLHRKKNADFHLNNLYSSRVEFQDIKIKLDFSEEYLKELKYLFRENEQIVKRIDNALINKNYERLILEFYIKKNNLNNKSKIEIFIHYLEFEKGKCRDNKRVFNLIEIILQKIKNHEDIESDLLNYHLDMYLEEEIKNLDDLIKYLEKCEKEFNPDFINADLENINDFEEAERDSFISEKNKLKDEIYDLKNNQEYKNKIEKIYNKLNALLINNQFDFTDQRRMGDSKISF